MNNLTVEVKFLEKKGLFDLALFHKHLIVRAEVGTN